MKTIIKSLINSFLLVGGIAVTISSIAGTTTWVQSRALSPSISPDGKFISFSSNTGGLTPDGTNGEHQIYVRNHLTSETAKVSVDNVGVEASGQSFDPASSIISANGRIVVFSSDADNLVTGDIDGLRDIFIHDRNTGKTSLVQLSFNKKKRFMLDNDPAFNISANGRFVVFHTIFLGYADSAGERIQEIYVYDRESEKAERVSLPLDGSLDATASFTPSISGDGRYVAFNSRTALVSEDTNQRSDIFVYDRELKKTTLVSVTKDGQQSRSTSTIFGGLDISADGRFVVFNTGINDLIVGDTNANADIYLKDLLTEELSRVSISSLGGEGNHSSYEPSISADGRYVVFSSTASNLVLDDTNGKSDVFVRDRKLGKTARVSVTSAGSEFTGQSFIPAISDNGRYITFYTNSHSSGVYLYDQGPTESGLSLFTSIDGIPNTIEPGPAIPNVGSPATTRITVENNDEEVARNVRVFGKTIKPVPDQAFTLLCYLGEITKGSSASCTSESLISSGNHKTIISAQGINTEGERVKAGTASYYVGGFDTATPSLELDVLLNGEDNDNTTPGEVLIVGDTATFTYSVTNAGPLTLVGVRVFDRTRKPVSGSWGRACEFPAILAGETVNCIRELLVEAGEVQRQVSVQSFYQSNVIRDGEFSYYTGQ